MPTAAATGLTVAVPGATTSFGGRSSFAFNPFGARSTGQLQTAGAPPKDDDEAVESDISHMARDIGRKCHHEGDEGDGDGTEETDGSDIEDMTAPAWKGKARQSPAKSTKRESLMVSYTDKDIDIVRADRYARDFPALQDYRNNEAPPTVTGSFNLASHTSYLDSVMDGRGITSRVVFGHDEGKKFLQQRGVKDFTLYDDGWKTPLLRAPQPADSPTRLTRP